MILGGKCMIMRRKGKQRQGRECEKRGKRDIK